MGSVVDDDVPLFSFGVIADIQYADEDDAFNFAQTHKRYYRNTLSLVDGAVKEWCKEDLVFVLQLGDIIDGKCEKYSERALNSVIECFKPLTVPVYHVVGNHELYNFSRKDLSNLLSEPFYYDFSPFNGFRVIVLNSFEESVLWIGEDDTFEQHYQLLEKNNPNQVRVKEGVNWGENLEGIVKRFVPYNGGISKTQLDWLTNTLHNASLNNETVFIASHCQLQEDCSSYSTLTWNYQQVLSIIHSYKNVVCCLYGHDHKGGYCIDSKGLHHITLQSPLESQSGSTAFGTIDIYKDKCELRGRGDVPSKSLPFKRIH